jgi:recombination DNA repair RAD52 pathway protein
MSKAKKTVRISENDLVNLIDNIVSEAINAEKQKTLNESKKVNKVETKSATKKVVKISENDLIDLIDNIVSEAVNIKKKEWLSGKSKNQ